MTRVDVTYVVERTGLAKRTVQDMAKRGDVPSATKPFGLWTFDKDTIDLWVRKREIEGCPKMISRTSICEKTSGGSGKRWRAGSIEKAYTQAFLQ